MLNVKIESHWRGGQAWSGEIPDPPEDADVLSYVWRFFNRVDDDDGARLEAIGYDLPSLSVDDVVELDGNLRFRVAMLGFVPIE
jgi:allophanate hydrolase subunit 1